MPFAVGPGAASAAKCRPNSLAPGDLLASCSCLLPLSATGATCQPDQPARAPTVHRVRRIVPGERGCGGGGPGAAPGRPPRAPDASGTPRPGSGLSLAWPIRAPSARRATARRRDRRRGPSGLTPAWPGSRCVLASPDARSRRSRRPARAPPDPSASTAARTRAALSAPLSPFTRAVLPWADASSRPAGEPPRARRRRPQLLQRPLMASRAFPGRLGDRRWAAVHRRGSHARLATLCAIRAVSCVLRGVSTLSLRTNCYKPAHYTIWTQPCAPGPIRPAPVAGSATHTVLGASVGSMVMVHHHGALRDRSSAYSASGQHG